MEVCGEGLTTTTSLVFLGEVVKGSQGGLATSFLERIITIVLSTNALPRFTSVVLDGVLASIPASKAHR